MPWDDDKSTAADPDNPTAAEQVTADEWDTHVADQKSRVLYGPLADRPNAGDVPDGTVYLITDLANNGGVLTEVVSGAWQIKQIGDDSNRPDVFGDVIDANEVSADTADIGNSVRLASVTVSLADDAATSVAGANSKILNVLGDGGSGNESGVFGTNFDRMHTYGQNGMSNEGGGTTLSGTTGTDGSLNISRDGNDIYLENRTGDSRDVAVLRFIET